MKSEQFLQQPRLCHNVVKPDKHLKSYFSRLSYIFLWTRAQLLLRWLHNVARVNFSC